MPRDVFVGEAAGALAAYCLQNGLAPRQVRSSPEHLEDFQRLLDGQGFELQWPEHIRTTEAQIQGNPVD